MAISYSISYTFSPSTTISSSQVNQNFTDNANTWTGLEAKTKTFSNLGIDTQLKSAGTIESADGAVGAPGITFSGDLDNGLYRVGSNNPALSAGGTKVIDMKTTGVAILGTTTNDAASAGFIGETVSSVVANQSPGGTDTYYDVTSISLTAGDWDITALCTANANTATWSAVIIGISVTSGNSATGLTNGDSQTNAFFASSSTTPLQLNLCVPSYRVSLTTTTVHYFKARVTYTVNTPTISGARLSARRVR